jgi:3-dehydroquinate synthase
MIRDPRLLELLEQRAEGLLTQERMAISDVVARSAAIKAKIVSEDEKEQGIRIILNYGHTIAHGLETATNYERFIHGEAVAIGMMGAAMISREVGLLFQEVVDRQKALLERFGLPTTFSGVDIGRILQAMELDKKVKGKKIRWVLLSGIGQPVVRDDISREVATSVIRKLQQS